MAAKASGSTGATHKDGKFHATVERVQDDLGRDLLPDTVTPNNPDNTVEGEIRDAVFQLWFDTGEDPLIKEIAAHLEWSDGKVRGVLDRNGGAVPGTNCTKRETPVRDRNFGGIIRHRLSAALTPAKSYLREIIGNR